MENGYVFQVEELRGYKADGTPVYYAEITGPALAEGGTDNRPKQPSSGKGVLCACSILIEDDGQVLFWSDSESDWAPILKLASV